MEVCTARREQFEQLQAVLFRERHLRLHDYESPGLERYDIGDELAQAVAARVGTPVSCEHRVNNVQWEELVIRSPRILTGNEAPGVCAQLGAHRDMDHSLRPMHV